MRELNPRPQQLKITTFFFSNNSAEEIISKKIEGIQKRIKVRDIPDEEKEVGYLSTPAIKRHFELEIKTLREAPRDADKLRKLVNAKRRELEDAIKIEYTERLFPEVEMLRFVVCAVRRNESNEESVRHHT
jgi:predicted metalloendopeptidase